ncbi:BQ2448_1251 [Microbotryum intermedium]|uniref:BQ2448_1251 protein n=1 Tax=Microbotryum intermedium TaxID=269621 RepID=A0A238F9N6_9BASI|nr:BQ2448_1251 [Microbotryum intermedium]
MDTKFSACDGLRAMTCCFPTCRWVALEGGPRNQGAEAGGRRWYENPTSSQSTNRTRQRVSPTTTTTMAVGRALEPFERGRMSRNEFLVRDWEDEEERDTRREADLLSLHDQGEFTRDRDGDADAEHDPSPSSSSRRSRTRRVLGGDIFGSGISWGSGLSRWTLLKSWWRGSGKGRIRLPEDDDEYEEGGRLDGIGGLFAPSRTSDEGNTTLMEGEGDGDAFEIREEIVDPPIDAPLSPTKSTATNLSEERGRCDETPEEREARRERRRARRRARELGLSVQDFDQGVVAEPDELLSSAVLVELEPTQRTTRSGRPRHYKSSSHSSSADFHLPDYPAQPLRGHQGEDASALSVVGEHGDDSYRDEYDEAERQARKEARRQRRAARAAAADGGGAYYEGGAPASSNGSDSSRSHYHRDPGSAASPRIDSTFLAAPINLHPHEAKRSRHRSSPSTSTTSTTSSSSRAPRPRKQQHLLWSAVEEEEAYLPSGPHAEGQYYLAEDGNYYLAAPQPMYVQDEHGQLRAVISHHSLQYDVPAEHLVGVKEVREVSSTTYNHVGVIPGKAVEEEGEGGGTGSNVVAQK